MATDLRSYDADLLTDVVGQDNAALSREAAESVLRWRFSQNASTRMHELAEKNRRDVLTPDERSQLESFLRVGQLLNLMHAKARRVLGQDQSSS
jgi:hypothetical protein